MRILKIQSSQPEPYGINRRPQQITNPRDIAKLLSRLRYGDLVQVICGDLKRDAKVIRVEGTKLYLTRAGGGGIFRTAAVHTAGSRLFFDGIVVGRGKDEDEIIFIGKIRVHTKDLENNTFTREAAPGLRVKSCTRTEDIHQMNLIPNALRKAMVQRYNQILIHKFPKATVAIHLQENNRPSIRLRSLQESGRPIYIGNSRLPQQLRGEGSEDFLSHQDYLRIRHSEGDSVEPKSEICIPIVYQKVYVHGFCLVSTQNSPLKKAEYDFVSTLSGRISQDLTNLYSSELLGYSVGIRDFTDENVLGEIHPSHEGFVNLHSKLVMEVSFIEQNRQANLLGNISRIEIRGGKELFELKISKLSGHAKVTAPYSRPGT